MRTKLCDTLEALKIFQDTWNVRPDGKFYFSEKLLTAKQIDDYDKALRHLETIIEWQTTNASKPRPFIIPSRNS